MSRGFWALSKGLTRRCLEPIYSAGMLGKSCTGRADGGSLLGWLAAVAAMRIFFLANQRWIPEYYEKRFGSVKRGPWSKWDAPFFSGFVVLLVIGQPIAHIPRPAVFQFCRSVHVMISDPAHQINLAPSFFWMAVFLSRLRWHMRRWERQESYSPNRRAGRVFLDRHLWDVATGSKATLDMEDSERRRVRSQLDGDGAVRSHRFGPRAAEEICGGRR